MSRLKKKAVRQIFWKVFLIFPLKTLTIYLMIFTNSMGQFFTHFQLHNQMFSYRFWLVLLRIIDFAGYAIGLLQCFLVCNFHDICTRYLFQNWTTFFHPIDEIEATPKICIKSFLRCHCDASSERYAVKKILNFESVFCTRCGFAPVGLATIPIKIVEILHKCSECNSRVHPI